VIRIIVALMLVTALTAEQCDVGEFGDLINRPATITVINTSATESAVVAIIADDAKSYPTLAPGQSATVKTNVGGRYEVRVVMTPENAAAYRSNLTTLRNLVEKQIDAATNAGEKTKLFIDLAGIKAAIAALSSANAAGCAGRVTLSTDSESSVSATLGWSPTTGGGFWDATCGSN
jgi:hypothetical protein